MFRKKKPKRLYYPTRSRWYTRPKRRKTSTSRKTIKSDIRSYFSRFFKHILLIVIVGGLGVILFLLLFFSSYFAITDIQVLRKDFNIDTAAITNQLNNYTGKNILFFPRKQIVNTIQENFPEFAFVNVKKVLPHQLVVELESHEIIANLRAYYLLPEPEPFLDEGLDDLTLRIDEALEKAFTLEEQEVEEPVPVEQKSLLNRIGQAIFDQEENLELMTVVVDGLTQPIEDRQFIVPSEKIDYLLETIQYFNNLFEISIEKVRYLPTAREIHLITNIGVELWLTTEKDYKKQIDKLNIIYEAAELDKEEVAYIDLRVREKVIYCLRNSRCNNYR